MILDKGTTAPGYMNSRGQQVVRNTRIAGNKRGQWVYELKCRDCGHHYGSIGIYIHNRRCPKCQGGARGLSLK